MITIFVDTEQEKFDLLEASEHIHYLEGIDTDIPMVSILAHLYIAPHIIKIRGVYDEDELSEDDDWSHDEDESDDWSIDDYTELY